MGVKAEDTFFSINLFAEDAKKFDTVKGKFTDHFDFTKNVIFEKAKFNLRVQKPGETAESFITALHRLAEHCDYGILHDQLIRNHLVVGIRDSKISEKLQLDKDLTLDKAVKTVTQGELIRKQQSQLRSSNMARAISLRLQMPGKPRKPPVKKFGKQSPSKPRMETLVKMHLNLVVDVVKLHVIQDTNVPHNQLCVANVKLKDAMQRCVDRQYRSPKGRSWYGRLKYRAHDHWIKPIWATPGELHQVSSSNSASENSEDKDQENQHNLMRWLHGHHIVTRVYLQDFRLTGCNMRQGSINIKVV